MRSSAVSRRDLASVARVLGLSMPLVLSAVASAFAGGCGSGSNVSAGDASADATATSDDGPGPDGSQSDASAADGGPDGQVSNDADADAEASDSSPEAAAGGDGAADASEAGASDIVLFAGVDNAAHGVGATYASGQWTSGVIGSDVYSVQGGGVVVTPGGHGLAVFRGNTNAVVEFASWNGTWSMLASEGTSTNSVGAPYAGGTGAFLAYQNGSVGFAQYDEATMAWSPANQATGASSDNSSLPAVVAMSTGAPMALFTGVNGLAQQYGYSIQSGTTWSSAAAITGSAAAIGISPRPEILAVQAAAGGPIVAAMNGAQPGEIDTAAYAGGAWTTTKNVVTDAATNQGRPFALTPLPDGRVALAYVDTNQGMHLGFFHASSWGAFAAVPGTGDRFPRFPIAIARGANGGAVLELVYLDGTGDSRTPQHVRLTNEAQWTWTSPVPVATGGFDAAYLAVGP